MRAPEHPETWADALEAACARSPALGIMGVRVLSETASTQDAAWGAGAGRAGWVVVGVRQTGGRGRLGRRWEDVGGLGLAMSVTLARARCDGAIAVRTGLAVLDACAALTPGGEGMFGVRWPNDVVARADGRKVAGVLVEARDATAIVGVGVNVRQRAEEWTGELVGRAASLRELGSEASRIDTACAIVERLGGWLDARAAEVAARASALDTLRGSRRAFTSGGRRVEGEVLGVGERGTISVRCDDGSVSELAPETTSLEHGS